jgi:WD40 repeat protein
MNGNGQPPPRAFGSLIAFALISAALLMVWNRPGPVATAQENTLPAEQPQPPLPSPPDQLLTPTPTPRIVMVSPLPSPPPIPTLPPTPVVTRIPLAAPPYLSVPVTDFARSYTVFWRDDNLVKSINSSGGGERTLVDVHAQTALFLGRREANVWEWGSASPDGTLLALVLTNFERLGDLGKIGLSTYIPPRYYIYLLDVTTGALRLLAANAKEPVWSPDGARLAFFNTATHGLDVIDLDTGVIEEVFAVEPHSERRAAWFAWSPDGQSLAVVKAWDNFALSGGIWITDAAAGSAARQVVEMEMNAVVLGWSSPDNVLFVSGAGENATAGPVSNLWVVDTESGYKRQLTSNISLFDAAYLQTPEGGRITFTGPNLLEQETAQYDLWLMATDGSQLQRLTDDAASEIDLAWSPDGGRILFEKHEQGLWELDIASGATKQILPQVANHWLVR